MERPRSKSSHNRISSTDSTESVTKAGPLLQEKEIKHGRPELVSESPRSPATDLLKRWPTNALPTHYTRQIEAALDFYDVILVLVPILMIVKAILCVCAQRKDYNAGHYGIYIEYASRLSKRLVEVNNQMTTIYTILFLVIMGTMFKRLALWKAQKGAKISELELFQASVSPTSTLRMIASLRIFTLTSFLVASVWVWYYVGSQAANYEFTLKNSFKMKDYPIALLGPDALSPFEDGTWAEYTQIQKTDSNSLFHVYAQKVKGSTDGIVSSDIVYNALPILYHDESPDTVFKRDASGWADTPSNRNYQIISAIGTNFYVNQVFDAAEPSYRSSWHIQQMLGSFTFNATYFYISCGDVTLSTKKAPEGLGSTFVMSMNMTNTTGAGEKRTFDFWNMYNTTHALEAVCGTQQLNQEVEIKCDPKACKVSRVRSRPGFANPSNETRLFDDDTVASSFFDSMLFACGRPVNVSDISTFEADNGLAPLKASLESGEILPTDLTAGTSQAETQGLILSGALTKYVNTYIAASKHLKYEHGFNIQELTSNGRNITIETPSQSWTTLKMQGAEYEPNYAISWPWIIVDILSSCVLLVAAIFAFWLRKKTHAPDIFGYVSSLTRDNANLDFPGGSALGGIDRTRMMKHVKVKLGEMPIVNGPGRIVLTYYGDDERCAKDLEKGKFYF